PSPLSSFPLQLSALLPGTQAESYLIPHYFPETAFQVCFLPAAGHKRYLCEYEDHSPDFHSDLLPDVFRNISNTQNPPVFPHFCIFRGKTKGACIRGAALRFPVPHLRQTTHFPKNPPALNRT